ncbi:MAG TPA: phosphatidate cytidylyltransferase [Actinomycetota bacterium]
MSEDERREDVDDLFGDLDDFFAPIDDVEWPEGAEREEAEGEGAKAEKGEAEGEAEAAEPNEWAPAIEIPDEEELVGRGELGEPDAEAAEAAEAEDPSDAPPPEQPAPEEPEPSLTVDDFFDDEEAEAPEEEEEEEEEIQPTAEMSGEDWARLRSALGEDEEPEEPVEPRGEEAAEPRELTIDDLADGPDQYEELRGEEPGDEEAVLAEEAIFEPAEGQDPEGVEVAADEPATEEEVEAAAAHFASGIEPEEVERDLLSDLDEEAPARMAAEPEPVEEPEAEAPEEAPAEDVFEDEEGRKVMRVTPRPTAPLEGEEEPLPLGGTGAPTWQEPAAYAADEEVPAEAGAPPPGRNLGAAVASGVILAAAAVALLAIDKGPFVWLAVAVVLLGQGELYAVLRTRGFQPATAIGLLAGLFVMVGAYTRGGSGQGEAAMLFGLALAALFSPLWFMAAAPSARRGLVANVGVTLLGVLYAPFLASFALLLLAIPGNDGRNLLLTVVGLTVLYDVCAYGVGTFWGDRPLAPTISPRKSWEGAIGATFIVVLVALAIVPLFEPFDHPGPAVGLAIVIAIAAPLGDLAESAIKRDLGVKDMSSLLPGHGGVLDRLDAILFTAPAAYYFLRLVL